MTTIPRLPPWGCAAVVWFAAGSRPLSAQTGDNDHVKLAVSLCGMCSHHCLDIPVATKRMSLLHRSWLPGRAGPLLTCLTWTRPRTRRSQEDWQSIKLQYLLPTARPGRTRQWPRFGVARAHGALLVPFLFSVLRGDAFAYTAFASICVRWTSWRFSSNT